MRNARDIMTETTEKVVALPSQTIIAVKMIAGEVVDLYVAHPKKMFAFTLFELWVHSLMFQHLTELKSLSELIPFFGY